MPDGTINIYVDTSFISAVSGTEDVNAFFSAGQLESVGLRDISSYFTAANTASGELYTPVEFFVTNTTQSGFHSTAATFELDTVTSGGVVTCLVDFSAQGTTSGTEDVNSVYDTGGGSKVSTEIYAKVSYTAGSTLSGSSNVAGSYWTFEGSSGTLDYEGDYTAGGEYDPLIPGPPEDQVIISGTWDVPSPFTASDAGISGANSTYCDVTFTGYPMEFHPEDLTYRFHLTSGLEGTTDGSYYEATAISGGVLNQHFEAISTVSNTRYYNTDMICAASGIQYENFEVDSILGRIGYNDFEGLCTVSGVGGYGFDVDLFSLKISNFSLDVNGYTAASGIICVDITDDVYNVVTSGTYFIVGDTIVSGIFTSITDGYTMCYDSPTDFQELVGSTEITVHAMNDNGDILEQDFYLTSGYIVEYDNRTQDYGFDSQVVVRGTAENNASCPDTGTDAYFFTTIPKEAVDLGAFINGQPWGEKDLGASISATTDTIYFYGKKFRIEVRAKDFAGNVMEPFVFEFQIEDKPE